jgi:hypothetical protein
MRSPAVNPARAALDSTLIPQSAAVNFGKHGNRFRRR